MIKDINLLATTIAPNPKDITHWIDLSEDPTGGVIKTFDGNKWNRITNPIEVNLSEIESQVEGLQNTIDVHKVDSDNKFDQVNDKLDEHAQDIESIETVTSKIVNNGDGTKYLSDNGTYSVVSIPTKVSELQNDSNYQTAEQVDTRIQGVVDSAPEALDTLKEIADALNNDPDFAATMTTELSKKADKTELPTATSDLNNDSGFITGSTTVNSKALSTNPVLNGADIELTGYIDGTSAKVEATDTVNEAIAKLEAKIKDLESRTIEDILSYGVEWDITDSSPVLTRIGNMDMHRTLPIQSQYRGCVVKGNKLQYWLDANDWSLKEDGTPSVLDGTDGDVRIYIPRFFGKSGSNGNKRWGRISTIQIDSSWQEIPEMYIDAYRSVADRTDNSNIKFRSVVNTTEAFRGGTNSSTYDTYLGTDNCRTLLGKPTTNINRATARTYAKNTGSELLCYNFYKWIFYWAYVIEYANFNCQAAFNSTLTSEGYHQGGLGNGVTTVNGTYWGYYNSTNPLTPCGYCNDLGNGTGIKEMTLTMPTSSDGTDSQSYTLQVPRWRGFDNPFGDIWTNVDGINIIKMKDEDTARVYATSDAELFGDSTSDNDNMTLVAHQVMQDGYITEFDLGETGEIVASKVNGSSITYMCDYNAYPRLTNTVMRTIFGGAAFSGSGAGFGDLASQHTVSSAGSSIGFRTLNRV